MKKLSYQDVTPEDLFYQRRKIMKGLGILATSAVLPNFAEAKLNAETRRTLEYQKDNSILVPTTEKKIIGYNNYYEFGVDKSDPAKLAKDFKTDPWVIEISGEVEKPVQLDMATIFKTFPLEERIYRLRCVEAWSMVVPWVGFELGRLLEFVKPTSKAKFVAFETRYDPENMPGQRNAFLGGGLKYPYTEGLTLAEAMHPLTILAVGLYGKTLTPQNGAPIRLVVPWKYGFKNIKAISKIRLTETQPETTWNLTNPSEYGFYANVNPNVDHPRWSQASERIIGSEGLFDVKRQPTLMFNGYEKEVAHLYQGLDLRKNF